jgi:hypothetical protein
MKANDELSEFLYKFLESKQYDFDALLHKNFLFDYHDEFVKLAIMALFYQNAGMVSLKKRIDNKNKKLNKDAILTISSDFKNIVAEKKENHKRKLELKISLNNGIRKKTVEIDSFDFIMEIISCAIGYACKEFNILVMDEVIYAKRKKLIINAGYGNPGITWHDAEKLAQKKIDEMEINESTNAIDRAYIKSIKKKKGCKPKNDDIAYTIKQIYDFLQNTTTWIKQKKFIFIYDFLSIIEVLPKTKIELIPEEKAEKIKDFIRNIEKSNTVKHSKK